MKTPAVYHRPTFLLSIFFVALSGLLQILPGTAFSSSPVHIPKPLEPWKTWVLEGKMDRDCPFLGDGMISSVQSRGGLSPRKVCAWPSPLNLEVTARGARFEQHWTLYNDASVPLPGDSQYWPIGVTANKRLSPVISQGGTPTVFLKKGQHSIKGKFQWNAPPKWLTIPQATGLVRLSLKGNPVPFPRFNQYWESPGRGTDASL